MEHLIDNFFDEVEERLDSEVEENFALFIADVGGAEHVRIKASVIALSAFLVKNDQVRELFRMASTIAEQYVEHELEDF
ncbi:hypothetical protein [Mammaliicoccus sciuri]|uniref:hypothetical protein n=1 Tax=Mammaliicoccus sciuri TaxID=1296 RepID=UPI000D1F379A|nr:hypothetical protein [Mammaliicoccus sciuri]PTJ54218.1 hypothetical protein BU012_01070 [Mammaliicoccus sciuri]